MKSSTVQQQRVQLVVLVTVGVQSGHHFGLVMIDTVIQLQDFFFLNTDV